MKSDFKRFQDLFSKYQNLFGCTGYKVYFEFAPIESGDFATITVNQENMVATARLNSKLGYRDKPFVHIHQSAKHEAIHLLLWRLYDRATSRYACCSEIGEADEELVFKLEKLIPDVKENER